MDHLHTILRRLETEPPIFSVSEATASFGTSLQRLNELGVLRTAASAAAVSCPECGSGPLRIEYVTDLATRLPHGYVACGTCGTSEVDLQTADRVAIDVPSLIRFAFRPCEMTPLIEEIVPRRLWRVGKMALARASRAVFFARGVNADLAEQCRARLADASTAILFVPTERGVRWWRATVRNPVLSLESTSSWGGGDASFDRAHVEGQVRTAAPAIADSTARPRPKRGVRAAKIETLRNELIEHLRAAKHYAEFNADNAGVPELLPRPTQKELAKRTGMSETDVCRCLKDDSARELQLYWNTALDLSAILRWTKPSIGEAEP